MDTRYGARLMRPAIKIFSDIEFKGTILDLFEDIFNKYPDDAIEMLAAYSGVDVADYPNNPPYNLVQFIALMKEDWAKSFFTLSSKTQVSAGSAMENTEENQNTSLNISTPNGTKSRRKRSTSSM